MKVNLLRLHPDAVAPSYGTAGAACFDLATYMPGLIRPGASRIFPTGLAFEIPDGWVMRVYSRSGHGFKFGVRLVNGVGVIDSDYRGEVMIGLHNDSTKDVIVDAGDRIAQALVEPVQRCRFEFTDALSETARGAGGFGSTN